MRKPTERQREFRTKLGELLAAYASVVGPEFDGEDEGESVQMPVPTRWFLVAEWADLADGDNGPFVIIANSGVPWVDQLGLIHAAKTMVESQ